MEVAIRVVIFGLLIYLSTCSNAIAENIRTENIRLKLDKEKISVLDEGIFLLTENLGPIGVGNIQYDERGYYTICSIGYICSCCKKSLERNATVCDLCGGEDINIRGMGDEPCHDYLTAQAIICAFLADPSKWEDFIHISTTVRVKGAVNTDGEQSATVEVEKIPEDSNHRYKATAEVKRDKNGKSQASAELEFEIDF